MWRTLLVLGIFLTLLLCVEARRRRRHRKHCPTDDHEDRVCCNEIEVTETHCEWFWTTCDNDDPFTYWNLRECQNNHEVRSKRSYHDDHWATDGCSKWKPSNFTYFSCVPYCCNGWKEDEWGFCTIPDDQVVDIVCENGGTPSPDGTYCTCLPSFSGSHCETPICDSTCQNFGSCVSMYGIPQCLCQQNFTGKYCETPVCEMQCHHRGDCVGAGYTSYCACKEGYTGVHCEQAIKEGDCPESKDRFGTCIMECYTDGECSGKDKCCFNGCGHSCTAPFNASICEYKGVKYPHGARIKKNDCRSCVCLGHISEHSDGFSCAVVDCPSYFSTFKCPQNTVLQHIPGKCCPECVAEPPEPTPSPVFRPPAFKNCPNDITRVDVGERNQVQLHVALRHIVATDHDGKVMAITYSKVTLSHCACGHPYRNDHAVTLTTAPDSQGRTASCTLTVRVHDPKPPKFISCPSNIQGFDDEKISWSKPHVGDNVGIRNISLASTFSNNSKIVLGNHMMTYIASDHQGNVAVCSFIIQIWKRDSTDPSMPSTLKHRKSEVYTEEEEDKTKLYWIMGVVAGVIAVVAAIIIVVCCVKKSRSAGGNRPPSQRNLYDNGEYGSYAVPPPGYDNIMKLPPYTVNTDPPVYDEIEKRKLPDGTGIDNPVYADPDEVKVSVQNLENTAKA